jgi:uncharacterized radical SAM superfamily Fe-S cluster-containing enzyme
MTDLITQPLTDLDVLLETTRSICPECRRVIDAELVERDNRVIMRKRCPEHGPFEALVFGDADLYHQIVPFNKPGARSLRYATEVRQGCPHDCGLCPDHRQHLCLGIIEVNDACNLECPVCLADAGPRPAAEGFELTLEQVELMLDGFVASEGRPEVVQFSGGEPSLHPRILDFIQLAQDKGLSYVMLNTNGLRIARDDRFLAGLARLKPHIYLQFDGFEPATQLALRGRADLTEIKLRALDRLAEADIRVVLVPAIERGVNEHEIGALVEFGLRHPAVFGVSFQSVFHAQRHLDFDPLQRITTPDILKALEAQTGGLFRLSDFIPIPCCAPTCGFTTYAMLSAETVTPLPRVLEVDQYLNYVTNRSMPDLDAALLHLLESLWSASAQVGTEATAEALIRAAGASSLPAAGPGWTTDRCASCRVGLPLAAHRSRDLSKHVFMISSRDFMDPWTFDLRDASKCCIGELLPDGRTIPFCVYNTCGYRERAMESLRGR